MNYIIGIIVTFFLGLFGLLITAPFIFAWKLFKLTFVIAKEVAIKLWDLLMLIVIVIIDKVFYKEPKTEPKTSPTRKRTQRKRNNKKPPTK